jgi:FkbM family methyltransferase
VLSAALMNVFAAHRERAVFVQIGANDGEFLDPLRPYIARHAWRGVMVEPIPHVFARLQARYAGEARISLENAAVAASDGKREMFHVAVGAQGEGVPVYADALASFDRGRVRSHLEQAADPDGLLRRIEVPCVSFDSLCRRHGLQRPDLILIDAEGADGEIVEAIDLERRGPRLLVYEHHHLEAVDRERCERRLAGGGYELVEDGLDTWALDLGPSDRLSDAWRRALEDAR